MSKFTEAWMKHCVRVPLPEPEWKPEEHVWNNVPMTPRGAVLPSLGFLLILAFAYWLTK